MKDRLIALLLTFPFAAALIWGGHVLIEQSNIVVSEDYKDQLNGAGTILQWMGGISVFLVIFELVLWPWYSIKDAWDRHKDDPAFAGRMAQGWLTLCGLLIHALLWSSS